MSILSLIENRIKTKNSSEVFVIAIDGRAASGKTTLAKMLESELNATILHLDDFFLPQDMRTEDRLNEAGGNVHYERFIKEVLPYINQKEAFEYGIYDCHQNLITGKRKVSDSRIRIVEGCYSTHPKFGDYADLKLFCTIDPDIQMKRILKRNGEEMAKRFGEVWIPLEEAYFTILDMDKYELIAL